MLATLIPLFDEKTANKRSKSLLTIVCVFTMLFNIVSTPASAATEYDIDLPYLGLEEVDTSCYFNWLDSEGNSHTYNYSMMYVHNQEDITTFYNILNSNDCYMGWYLMTEYISERYGKEYFLKLLGDIDLVNEVTPKIYDEVRDYYSLNRG